VRSEQLRREFDEWVSTHCPMAYGRPAHTLTEILVTVAGQDYRVTLSEVPDKFIGVGL
jgi:hypothetical protein